MSTRKIAASTFWQLGSQAAMAVLSIITSKFIAVGLSKELAGHYNSAYGYLQIFGILADFGLYAVAVREVSKAADKVKTLGVLLVLRSIILVLSLGAAILFVWIIPVWRGTPFPVGVTIAALVPFFTLLAGMIRTVYQVEYKMHFVFIAEVLQRVLTTACIGVFVFWGVRSTTDVSVYEAFLWIGGAGAFVLFLVSVLYADHLIALRPTFDRALMKKIFLLAAPYGIAYLCMAFYRQLDVVFITLLRPDFAIQNAYYGFAGRMEDMAFLVPTFLLNSVLPILSDRSEKKQPVEQLLGKTILILLYSGSIFLLFSLLWSRQLTLLLTTHAYLSTPGQPGSDTAFQLLSVPMLLNGIVLYSFYILLTRHAWKRLAVSLALGALLSAVLNYLLVPPYGFVGAASALIAVHVFLSIILLPQAQKVLPARVSAMQMLQWIAFSVVLAGALWVLLPFTTSIPRTIGGLVVVAACIAAMVWVLGIHRTLLRSAQSD
jgi:O-antigen/teichoic acid export membrane protein